MVKADMLLEYRNHSTTNWNSMVPSSTWRTIPMERAVFSPSLLIAEDVKQGCLIPFFRLVFLADMGIV